MYANVPTGLRWVALIRPGALSFVKDGAVILPRFYPRRGTTQEGSSGQQNSEPARNKNDPPGRVTIRVYVDGAGRGRGHTASF